MKWVDNICLLCAICFTLLIMVLASKPVSSGRKTQMARRNKSVYESLICGKCLEITCSNRNAILVAILIEHTNIR